MSLYEIPALDMGARSVRADTVRMPRAVHGGRRPDRTRTNCARGVQRGCGLHVDACGDHVLRWVRAGPASRGRTANGAGRAAAGERVRVRTGNSTLRAAALCSTAGGLRSERGLSCGSVQRSRVGMRSPHRRPL